MSVTPKFIVRRALKSDCGVILDLIKGPIFPDNASLLLKCENVDSNSVQYPNFPKENEVRVDLIENGFGKSPLFECFVAVIEDDVSAETVGKVVGFLLYFYVYSTWEGRVIYMENFYVKEQYRCKGVGTSLWKTVIREGLENGCTRLDFHVLEWYTQAINFFQNKGAINMKLLEGWNLFRLNENAMKKLCSEELQNKLENQIFSIRAALPTDCEAICNMIQELADYGKCPDGPKINKNDLLEDGFGKKPFYRCFVAEMKNELPGAEKESKMIGFVLYFDMYSSFKGRHLYMEDLYVTEQYRSKGIGTLLFKSVVQEGLKNDCGWVDFSVLDWNTPSINFYKSKGAVNITVSEKWNTFRLNVDAMKKCVEHGE